MSPAAADGAHARGRGLLDAAVSRDGGLTGADRAALATLDPDVLDGALRAFADEHGARALPVLSALTAEPAGRAVRRAARRALYRLSQRGLTPPATPAPRPVVEHEPPRAARAWLSGIDGSGSRATWILFDDGGGTSTLCSLILNDTVGVMDVAGGGISKRRLAAELAELRATQKLPWVDTDPPRAVGLVAEALALHRTLGTAPPPGFARWRPRFEAAPAAAPPPLPAEPDSLLVERSVELLELPELAGWFLDPDAVQADALDLLQVRESRLVVSDQIKAEREEAIVARVIERELGDEPGRRWSRRLAEMALIFDATDRADRARVAEAAAALLARDAAHHPFARALARRGLEVAGEVAVGRLRAADVSRKPG